MLITYKLIGKGDLQVSFYLPLSLPWSMEYLSCFQREVLLGGEGIMLSQLATARTKAGSQVAIS